MSKRSNSLKSLKIVVNGTGIVPRTMQLAPITEPIDVDMKQINLILRTPELTPRMVSPLDGHKLTLTRQNLGRMIKLYEQWLIEKDRQESLAEEAQTEYEASQLQTKEEKAEIAKAKSRQEIPAAARNLTKNDVADAIETAFAKKDNPEVKPVISPIKSVADVAIKKAEPTKVETKSE